MSLYDSNTYIQDLKTSSVHSVGLKQFEGEKILITGATDTIGYFLIAMSFHYD